MNQQIFSPNWYHVMNEQSQAVNESYFGWVLFKINELITELFSLLLIHICGSLVFRMLLKI